jgi:hypothetical protein
MYKYHSFISQPLFAQRIVNFTSIFAEKLVALKKLFNYKLDGLSCFVLHLEETQEVDDVLEEVKGVDRLAAGFYHIFYLGDRVF